MRRPRSRRGADAVVVTAPFYARTSQPEIIDHFRYVRDALDVPVIAYDIPVCVHSKLERATTVTLAREGADRRPQGLRAATTATSAMSSPTRRTCPTSS